MTCGPKNGYTVKLTRDGDSRAVAPFKTITTLKIKGERGERKLSCRVTDTGPVGSADFPTTSECTGHLESGYVVTLVSGGKGQTLASVSTVPGARVVSSSVCQYVK